MVLLRMVPANLSVKVDTALVMPLELVLELLINWQFSMRMFVLNPAYCKTRPAVVPVAVIRNPRKVTLFTAFNWNMYVFRL